MVEFRLLTRGAGLAEAIASGLYCESYFLDTLDRGPEPLLPEPELARLRDFLVRVHPRRDRRKKAEQQEGLELSALVRASKADALCDEARDVLIRRIEGVSLRPAHRPIRISSNSDLNTIRYMSAYLKLHIQDRLEASQPLDIPDWGVVEEDARSIKMPLATRALYLAGKELSDRGFDVPALPRLRNLIIGLEANIRELKVNDRERDPV